jgi:hypothetical protein
VMLQYDPTPSSPQSASSHTLQTALNTPTASGPRTVSFSLSFFILSFTHTNTQLLIVADLLEMVCVCFVVSLPYHVQLFIYLSPSLSLISFSFQIGLRITMTICPELRPKLVHLSLSTDLK